MTRKLETVQGSDTAIAICGECADQMRQHQLTPEEIASIKPGVFVKVSHNQEGFFVKVEKVEGDRVTGIVWNDLLKEHPFKFGDFLEVTLDEIYQVYTGE